MRDMNLKTNKPVILAIFGKSAAGKDTLKDILRNYPTFNIMQQWTTRPMRDNECQNYEYHFCSIEDFTKQLLSPESMLEAASYKDWYYGTPTSEIIQGKINVGIFGPKVLDCLIEEQRNYNIFFVEIQTPDRERLFRSLKRNKQVDCSEICRRFLADEKDFNEFHLKLVEEIEPEKICYLNGECLNTFGNTVGYELIEMVTKTFGPIKKNNSNEN